MKQHRFFFLPFFLFAGTVVVSVVVTLATVSLIGIKTPIERQWLSGGDDAGTLRETGYLDEESATIDVVRSANQAVVSIAIKKDISTLEPNIQSFPFDDFFGFPFFDVPQGGEPDDQKKTEEKNKLQQVGGGSGFLVTKDGLVVTNRHVVEDETAVYTVILTDGTEYNATVVAKDPVFDVALLRIEGDTFPVLALGDSESVQLGQTVIAIGNALAEFGNTVTRGVVSGVNRRVEAGDGLGQSEILDEAIQTDAAINPGNSGGPLLNLAGQVIGINTAVSRQGQLVGFAIPINTVKRSIESVIATGRIVRPWLGIRYIPVTPRLAEENALPVTYGVLVVRGDTPEQLGVIPGSPADKAGLEENDIILEINGEKLEDKDSLSKKIAGYGVEEQIMLKILHDGKEKDVSVTLEEYPADTE